MKTKTLKRIGDVFLILTMTMGLLLSVFASTTSHAGTIKGDNNALTAATECANIIFNLDRKSLNSELSSKDKGLVRGCKAVISNYDSKLNDIEQKAASALIAANASSCYMYGIEGGIKSLNVESFLTIAASLHSEISHNYYVGRAMGRIETTARYTDKTKRKSALSLYINSCITHIKELSA